MEQVFAKFPLANHGFQIAVSGGEDAAITGNRFGATDALKGLLLEHTQQFYLRIWRQVSDFVEKERAFVRLLETTDAPLICAGECARFIGGHTRCFHTSVFF